MRRISYKAESFLYWIAPKQSVHLIARRQVSEPVQAELSFACYDSILIQKGLADEPK